MTGFVQAFGSHRGVTDGHRRDRDIAEALAAFAAHQPCANRELRVLTYNADSPVRDGEQALYAFLTDPTNRLLAVSYRGEGAWRLKGIPEGLAQAAGIPRRYDTLGRMARVTFIRRALTAAGIYTSRELLDELAIDDPTERILEALSEQPREARAVLADADLDNDADSRELLAGLRDSGLVATPELVARLDEDTLVALTEDGLVLQKLWEKPLPA